MWPAIKVIFLLALVTLVKTEEDKQPTIAIVGAGVSGIAAATRLIQHGFTNLVILEAENRIGGRIHSTKTGDWTAELGAEWVHGETGNPVYDIAAPLMLLDNKTDEFPNGITLFSDKVVLENDVIMKIWSQEGDTLNKTSPTTVSGSLYDFLNQKLLTLIKNEIADDERADAYLRWILRVLCDIEGCDTLKDVSAKGFSEYDDVEGSPLVTWKGSGYKTLFDLLLKTHEKSSGPPIDLEGKLYLNTEVSSIVQTKEGIEIITKNGTSFTADLIIVTVSLAVLKDRQATFFEPALPEEKKKAVEVMGIGTVDKIILRFPHAWWPSNTTGFDLIWLHKDKILEEGHFPWEYGLLYFMTDDWSPFTLSTWINGEAARSMETHTLEDVKKGVMNVLKKFLGHKFSIPEPFEVLRSTWGTNPHFLGAYSYRSVASEEMNITAADLAKPVADQNGKEVIFFAGEATNGEHYGTVHGALETGWREADRIIKLYKN